MFSSMHNTIELDVSNMLKLIITLGVKLLFLWTGKLKD